MKKLLLIALLLFSGCSSVSIEPQNPNEFSVDRGALLQVTDTVNERAEQNIRPTIKYDVQPPVESTYCCKYCSKGKACGDSCISRSYTCHKGPGCACDSY